MYLNEVNVKGYRALVDVLLPVHPLTVMIGPNGSGKSSLLEIFQILKAASQGRLEEFITSSGGFSRILSQIKDGRPQIEISLQVEIKTPESSDSFLYSFILKSQGTGYNVAQERGETGYKHWQNPESRSRELSWSSMGAKAVKDIIGLQETEMNELGLDLRERMSKTGFLSYLDISPRAPVRLPQPLIPSQFPGPNGESLFSALYNLREVKGIRSSFDRILELLHLAFPDFDYLELPVVGAGQITLAWHQKDLTIPLFPNQLSEGTLRFLWLAATLLSPEPPPLLLMDEPEISLHPELLKLLAALLQDASSRTQIIVATHSSDLIRWLRPDEVVVIDKQDGKAKFTWIDDSSFNLQEWLQEYTLGDLWLMGNLGGRP